MPEGFHRVDVAELVRGAARILWAANTTAKPSRIEDIIFLTAGASEVQTVTLGSGGAATGGTFTLSFNGYTTAALVYNITAAALQTALEGLGSIGTGNVTVTGVAGGPYTVTFAGVLASKNVATMTGTAALTGGAGFVNGIAIAVTTQGQGIYDAKPGWNELGATREGITINTNNSEDSFDIDQVQGNIGSAPNAWEVSVSTRLAEMTLERLQFILEGSAITTDSTPTVPEREVGLAGAEEYTERRIAVLFKRKKAGADKIRAYIFWRAQRAPQEASIAHQKGGDAQSVPLQLNVLADPTVADPKKQFYVIRDQV